jgi:hypothetical protein
MWLLLAAGLLHPAPCHLRTGPLVEKEETARAIADAVIAKKGAHDPDHDYRTLVGPDPSDPGAWRVSQELIVDLPVRGGGGLTFKISRCDGTISDAHYVR